MGPGADHRQEQLMGGGSVTNTQFPLREFLMRLEIQYPERSLVRERVPLGNELEPRRMLESAAHRV